MSNRSGGDLFHGREDTKFKPAVSTLTIERRRGSRFPPRPASASSYQDKKYDNGDKPLSGWKIFLDPTINGKISGTELSAIRINTAAGIFKDISAGTYIVRIASVAGYKSTTSTSYSIKLTAGQTQSNILFGQHH